jgi:nucleoid-associated protein YgaU
MLVVLGLPVINLCTGDDRGLLTCVRSLVDDRFELGLEADTGPTPEAAQPVPIDAPSPVDPAPEMQLAEAIVPIPVMEPMRSLAAPAPEKPVAPPPAPPKVIPAPRVAAIPDLPAIEPEVIAPATDEIDPAPIAVSTVSEAVPVESPPVESPPVEVPEPTPDPVAELPDLADFPTLDPAQTPDADPWFAPPAPTALPGGPLPLITAPVAADPEPVPPETRLAAAPEPAPDAAPVATPPVLEPSSVASIPGIEVPPLLPAPVAQPDPALVEMPPILPPAPPAEPEATVAAIDPVIPPDPEPAALVLAPTIDAIEIDGDDNFIAGNGPAGATMRLYVDGLPVGVSPVEGGRWLVEGTDLLTEEQQTLKVEALDPLTGRVLGDAAIVFEGPIPPAAEVPVAAEEVAPLADPVAEPSVSTEAEPEEAPELQDPSPDQAGEPVAAPAAPDPFPPIRPVIPKGESPSVTILRAPGAGSVTILSTGTASGEAVVTLDAAPATPAIIAQFTLPALEAAPDVTVLRAVPIGDPGAGRFVSGKAIIRRGDTLWEIAHRFYGRGIHYRTILRANREAIGRPSRIYPGQVIQLPLVYDD